MSKFKFQPGADYTFPQQPALRPLEWAFGRRVDAPPFALLEHPMTWKLTSTTWLLRANFDLPANVTMARREFGMRVIDSNRALQSFRCIFCHGGLFVVRFVGAWQLPLNQTEATVPTCAKDTLCHLVAECARCSTAAPDQSCQRIRGVHQQKTRRSGFLEDVL
jgi:hypothetical protein